MKRTALISLLSLCAALATGCVKDNPADLRTLSDIHWDVVCSSSAPQTKAASVLNHAADFASCVWELADGKHWGTAADRATAELRLAGPGEYYTGIVKYDPSIGKWKIPGKKLFWPEAGSYTFLSFTVGDYDTPSNPPSFENLASGLKAKFGASQEGISITAWDSDTEDSHRDVLISNIDIERSAAAAGYLGMDGVMTEFRHVLSQVDFRFLKSSQAINFPNGDIEGTTIRLKKVALKNFWHVGDLLSGGTIAERWAFAALPESATAEQIDAAKAASLHESLTLFDSAIDGERILSTSDASQSSYSSLYIPQDLFDKTRNFGSHVHGTATSLTETSIEILYTVQLRDQAESEVKTAIISFPENIEHNVWMRSKKYIYDFRIGARAIPIEFDADVSPWDVGYLNDEGAIVI